ncbi:hypothetical protein I6E29_09500 [Arcanobacterium haemolyticum]|nr:hypothetical protein [Arcanobacterium haemolyticum]
MLILTSLPIAELTDLPIAELTDLPTAELSVYSAFLMRRELTYGVFAVGAAVGYGSSVVASFRVASRSLAVVVFTWCVGVVSRVVFVVF